MIGALLAVQILGFPFSLLFGSLAKRVGVRPAILIGLGGYTLLTLLAFFMQTTTHFWLLAIGVSMFQGGVQALSRSMYASLIPAERSGEFFGFMALAGRASAVLGPWVFGEVSRASGGDQRWAVATIGGFFAVGLALLVRVREPVPVSSAGLGGE